MSNNKPLLSSIFQNGATALQFVQLYRFGILMLTGIVLAKMGVPNALIGVYETLIFISAAVSFFWVNGFMQNLLIQYPQEENKNALLQNTFWLLMFCRVVVAVGYFVFVFTFYPQYNIPGLAHLFKLFALVVLASGAAVVSEYIMLLRRQPKWLVIYSVLHYTAHIVIIAAAFYLHHGIEYTIYGLIILNALRFVVLLAQVFSQKIVKPEYKTIVNVALTALPLITAAFFSGSVEYISGFIVSGIYGEDDFALYRYGAKELPLTLLLANAFSAALIPQIAEAGKEVKAALGPIQQATKRHIQLLFSFCALLIIVSPILYPALFNPEFADSATIFNIFLLLVISRFVFPQSILLGLGHRRVILQASVLELFTALFAGFVLGWYLGIMGVAFSVVLASFVEKGYLMYRLQKLENIGPAAYIPLKTWGLFSAGVGLVFVLVHFFMFYGYY